MKRILLILLLFSLLAEAQQRCDCSQQIGNCSAKVSHAQGLLEVVTDTPRCAQVLYYLDGQPGVALVTDGREVIPVEKDSYQALQAGQCRVCAAREVAEEARLKVALQCEPDYLLATAETGTCLQRCESIDNPRDRAVCEHNCQQHSRCLEKSCVQSLRQQWSACERRCDREMQSSMAADIDAFQRCQSGCEAIKKEISSCPVL